jgi:hypothetical protein
MTAQLMSPLTKRIASLLASARLSALNTALTATEAQRASMAQAALIAASSTARVSSRRGTAN